MSLRAEVRWFAREMEDALTSNDHKRHWSGLTTKRLLQRLKQETAELERAVATGRNVVREAADVANFAMMIADNFEREQDDEAA